MFSPNRWSWGRSWKETHHKAAFCPYVWTPASFWNAQQGLCADQLWSGFNQLRLGEKKLPDGSMETRGRRVCTCCQLEAPRQTAVHLGINYLPTPSLKLWALTTLDFTVLLNHTDVGVNSTVTPQFQWSVEQHVAVASWIRKTSSGRLTPSEWRSCGSSHFPPFTSRSLNDSKLNNIDGSVFLAVWAQPTNILHSLCENPQRWTHDLQHLTSDTWCFVKSGFWSHTFPCEDMLSSLRCLLISVVKVEIAVGWTWLAGYKTASHRYSLTWSLFLTDPVP